MFTVFLFSGYLFLKLELIDQIYNDKVLVKF